MRGIAVAVLSLAMVSGAQASSILVLGAQPSGRSSAISLGETQTKAPSVVTVDAAATGATTSPSVVVLGESSISTGKVAAIPAPQRRNARSRGILVVRAGVTGSASAAPASAVAAPNGNVKAPTLRDAMAQSGRAPAVPQ